MSQERGVRIGIDWGGTKIEALAMDAEGRELRRVRIPTPRHDYERSIGATAELVAQVERDVGFTGPIGIGIPGTIVPATGLVKNANSTWLNGKPFEKDLAAAMGREVRCVNDANCLAVSEAVDGAAAGHAVVFAAILGTGCGAGIALHGRMHSGPNGVAGEWGHNSLPWQWPDEYPGEPCYCGQRGCIERWLCGPALEEDYRRAAGTALAGADIVAAADAGEPQAMAALERYEDRLARALAHVVNLLDPDIIVLGGGLSRIERLYRNVPAKIATWAFGGSAITQVVPAKHGDSSGVRGAARLWP
ncbi:MAG TPA: ROK family protein [Acidobacteriaceae bacterium]|nr:ROK family protein [Acidobacteriaceae bacterium]